MSCGVSVLLAAALFAGSGAVPETAGALGDLQARDLSPLTDLERPGGDAIVIVRDGVAHLTIVHALTKEDAWAARQLRDTIAEMTGVRLRIVRDKPGKGVTNAPAFYIGATTAARTAGLAAPTDHPEAHRVVSRQGSVYFLGKADFAVTDWCERELGARYYGPMHPSDLEADGSTNLVYGKSVVKARDLAVPPANWSDRPVFGYRVNCPYENKTWNRWAKGGNSHRGGVNVHAPAGWWREPDADDHLEIFALSPEGRRATSPLLCYGNPKTLAYYKGRVKKGIEEHRANPRAKDSSGGVLDYGRKIVTISQWDCDLDCACANCRKLYDEKRGASGAGSPIIWGYFTRAFAQWLKTEYPDWMIAILPYRNTCDVPPDPEDPTRPLDLARYGNVEAMLCTMPGLAMFKNEACRRHEEGLIRQWEKCTGRRVLNWHYSCWPAEFTSAPYVYGETIQRHYRTLRGDIVGSFVNGGYDLARLSLSGYVWMRCLYNPDIDVQAVYDGFATRMFGKAAAPMRELIRLQETGWNRPWKSDFCSIENIHRISYPRADVLRMRELLDEAERRAAGDEVVRARLAWYRSGFEMFFRESAAIASGTAFVPLSVPKAVCPPVIDGRLDDACWRSIAERVFVRAFDPTNTVPKYAGSSRMVWCPGAGGGVAFGFRFAEPVAATLVKRTSDETWGQDSFDVFLDPSGTGSGHYLQIHVDGTARMSLFTDGLDLKPEGIRVAKHVGDDYWSVEVFVPFEALKDFPDARFPTAAVNGCRWAGNFCRWRVGDARDLGDERTPGSVTECTRLTTRFSRWNRDPAAFGPFLFVE